MFCSQIKMFVSSMASRNLAKERELSKPIARKKSAKGRKDGLMMVTGETPYFRYSNFEKFSRVKVSNRAK